MSTRLSPQTRQLTEAERLLKWGIDDLNKTIYYLGHPSVKQVAGLTEMVQVLREQQARLEVEYEQLYNDANDRAAAKVGQ